MVTIGALAAAFGGGLLAIWSLSNKHWFLFLMGILISVFGLMQIFV